jgi:hypothetical protein
VEHSDGIPGEPGNIDKIIPAVSGFKAILYLKKHGVQIRLSKKRMGINNKQVVHLYNLPL